MKYAAIQGAGNNKLDYDAQSFTTEIRITEDSTL